MYNFNLIKAVELQPSDLKLSTLLEDQSRIAEFAIRVYFDMGMKGYKKFVKILKDCNTIEDFCETFYQQFMKPMSNFPGFFDTSVETENVNKLEKLTDNERLSVWSLFATKLNNNYPTSFAERRKIMLPDSEKPRNSEIPATEEFSILKTMKGIEYETFLDTNIPVFILNVFIDYLYAKWYGSKNTFVKDENNAAYVSFVKMLCENCFQHDERNPENYFAYALPMEYSDVMRRIAANAKSSNETFQDFVAFYDDTLQKMVVNLRKLKNQDYLVYLFSIKDTMYQCTVKREDHVHNGRFRIAYTFTMRNEETGNEDTPVIFYDGIVESDVYSFFATYYGQKLPKTEDVVVGEEPRKVELRDLDIFLNKLNTKWGITSKQADETGTVVTRWYNYEMGKRWIRITTGSYTQNGKGSAYCFIDTENGDIHKANGYKNVDKHVRGNIFGENPLAGLDVYGTKYLR